MTESQTPMDSARRVDEALASIRLPLENLEFTLEQYLMQHGCRLDTQTRMLLAGVRDCVGRVAVSTRRLEAGRGEAASAEPGARSVPAGEAPAERRDMRVA